MVFSPDKDSFAWEEAAADPAESEVTRHQIKVQILFETVGMSVTSAFGLKGLEGGGDRKPLRATAGHLSPPSLRPPLLPSCHLAFVSARHMRACLRVRVCARARAYLHPVPSQRKARPRLGPGSARRRQLMLSGGGIVAAPRCEESKTAVFGNSRDG